jgi:hypothetical protein
MNTRYLLSILIASAFSLSANAQTGKDAKEGEKEKKKKIIEQSGVQVNQHQTRLFFPMVVTSSINESMTEFTSAANRFYETHEIRQKYLSWFNENYPEAGVYLSMEKSAIPGTETAITIYRVNSAFIKAILSDTSLSTKGKFPAIIDSLMFRDVFLGADLASDITTKKITKEEEDARTMARLTAQTKPQLDRAGAKSIEGDRSREGKEMKEVFLAKARNRDAIFIDYDTKSPVFLEADLLADGTGDVEDIIYEFAFRWMIFANAYPELYKQISPKVKDYIYNNNWQGLYYYCRENLNPSAYQAELDFFFSSNNL